jgi:hypothetical protein
MAAANRNIRERMGSYVYRDFIGVPDYGDAVELPVSSSECIVRDFGVYTEPADSLADYDLIFVVLSGSDWDLSAAVNRCKRLRLLHQAIFIGNLIGTGEAKRLARLIGKPVWVFPFDPACYRPSNEKDRLISAIIQKKGGKLYSIF